MWDSPFYKLQNKKLYYLNTLTKHALKQPNRDSNIQFNQNPFILEVT